MNLKTFDRPLGLTSKLKARRDKMIIVFGCGVISLLIFLKWIDKKRIMDGFMKSFGQCGNDESDISLCDEYLHVKNKERDQVLMDDLDIDELFCIIDRSYSDVGKAYIFSQIFLKEGRHQLMEDLIVRFDDEKILRHVIYKLYQLSRQYSESLQLFQNHCLSKRDIVVVCMSLLCPIVFWILSLFLNIHLFSWLWAWFVFHIGMNVYYSRKTHDFMSQAMSYCALVSCLKALNDMDIFYGDEKAYIKTLTHHALRYMRMYIIFEKVAVIDIFYITELIKTLFCFPIFQSYILLTHPQLEKEYIKMYEYVGMVEMAVSIKSLRLQYDTCIPIISSSFKIEMKECYHPLLYNPVKNSWNLFSSCMISGSNASGKSTFLKTVGLNVIMAEAFHTCFADYFCYYPFDVYTSIHMKDDLKLKESYYVKEIKCLKTMVEHARQDHCLILIDEILKGTNERERMIIAEVLLDVLFQSSSLTIVTTHDLELIHRFSKQSQYYFKDDIFNQEWYCDYKIKEGIWEIGNAIKLMKIYGFDDNILRKLKEKCNS